MHPAYAAPAGKLNTNSTISISRGQQVLQRLAVQQLGTCQDDTHLSDLSQAFDF